MLKHSEIEFLTNRMELQRGGGGKSIDGGPNACARHNQESSLLGNVGDFDIREESYGVELSGE